MHPFGQKNVEDGETKRVLSLKSFAVNHFGLWDISLTKVLKRLIVPGNCALM